MEGKEYSELMKLNIRNVNDFWELSYVGFESAKQKFDDIDKGLWLQSDRDRSQGLHHLGRRGK